jgi:hypothetical protein
MTSNVSKEEKRKIRKVARSEAKKAMPKLIKGRAAVANKKAANKLKKNILKYKFKGAKTGATEANLPDKLSFETRNYLQVVFNPAHATFGARGISPNSSNGLSLFDYITNTNGISVTAGLESTALPTITKVYFVMMYGSSLGDSADNGYNTADLHEAYYIWVLPVDDNNNSIYDLTTDQLITQEFANDTSINNLSDAIQLIAASLRLKGLFEGVVNTTDNTQFVVNFAGANVRLRSLAEKYMSAQPNGGDIYSLIQNSTAFQTFTNSEGVAARYNPVQVEAQTNFYDMDLLSGGVQDQASLMQQALDVAALEWPVVYAEFKIGITPVTATTSLLNKLTNQLMDKNLIKPVTEVIKCKMVEDMTLSTIMNEYAEEKIDDGKIKYSKECKAYIDQFIQEQEEELENSMAMLGKLMVKHKLHTGEKINVRDYVKKASILNSYIKRLLRDIKKIKFMFNKGRIGAVLDYTITFPLKQYFRLFIDATIKTPTPLQIIPTKTDPNCQMIYMYMKRVSLSGEYPLVSNGNSFKNFMFKMAKHFGHAQKVALALPGAISKNTNAAKEMLALLKSSG